MTNPSETYENARVLEDSLTNAAQGTVKWSHGKSVFFSLMAFGWLIGGSLFFSWAAVAVFFILSGLTLCLGHSLGMHRKLIHQSFDCPDMYEKIGVWLGTLVGLGGPFTMMRTHDLRDWAQRQTNCHPFFSHQSSMLRDWWWQIHCKLHLTHAPEFEFPRTMRHSSVYRFIEATSLLQQLVVALPLWVLGGWGFVFWGICGRVTISILGHWFIGYHAHNDGHRDWHVDGAAVQGQNVRYCGLITFGECWHNNHHAFPGSARLGLQPDQIDPGWWVLKACERAGLVSNLVEPKDLPGRPELREI
ncbi:MAG: acyl-CoA desaturase [Pseudomonadota bacterium]